MTETMQTDVVVIGAGAVGENAADRVVRGGLRAVLVESDLVGGECSYWACMPSKALLRPGTALKEARSVAGSREAVTGTLETAAVLDRRDSFTSSWDDAGQAEWVAGAGIDLVRGRARLAGEREVEVATTDGGTLRIQARHAVVLATGSTPSVPPLEGLDSVDYWGTREATSSREIPERLVVIGGGVSGVELAQAYSRLGSRVTILARGPLLKSFPEPARALVEEGLKADGVDVHTNTSPTGVRKSDDGGVEVQLEDGGTVAGDRLLVSTGRHPNLAGLGLEDLGLDPRKLGIDPTGRVAGVDGGWLYAVGDAAGKVLLTHQGKYEARATGDVIAARAAAAAGNSSVRSGGDSADPAEWSRYTATADTYAVPQVVFTDPELAMVGRTLEQARADGINASETSLDIAVAGSSLYADNYRGWAQMVVDEDRKVLVGVTFAGPGVSELLHAATIAIVGEVPLERLWHAVPAYPTISEVWLRLLEKYGL